MIWCHLKILISCCVLYLVLCTVWGRWKQRRGELVKGEKGFNTNREDRESNCPLSSVIVWESKVRMDLTIWRHMNESASQTCRHTSAVTSSVDHKLCRTAEFQPGDQMHLRPLNGCGEDKYQPPQTWSHPSNYIVSHSPHSTISEHYSDLQRRPEVRRFKVL